MKIPWQSVNTETLDSLLEEIVTRDGTDYGAIEKSTEQKVTFARNQLKSGYAVLFWNSEIESATLLSPQQAAIAEADATAISLNNEN